MPRPSDKRERLVEAAAVLIHEKGYSRTTLADISRESGVPLGNVYYYFKTKEALAAAVIEKRAQEFRALFAAWESMDSPRDRLHAFLDLAGQRAADVAQNGCAVGSLCQELDKQRSLLSDEADNILRVLSGWASAQFDAMGVDGHHGHGIRFIAAIQGAMLMANALDDPGIVLDEVRRLGDWVDDLARPPRATGRR